MRVITGSARGMSLKTLDGMDVRPTTDKVKEAVFSIIQFEIEGRRVLDLFAGSGQLGIEALSRGAASAVFVDSDKAAISVIKDNISKTKLGDCATVIQTDSFSYLRMAGGVFDIAFLDPPYAKGILQKALSIIGKSVATGGCAICESPVDEELPQDAGNGLIMAKQYKYGKTAVTVYRKQENI